MDTPSNSDTALRIVSNIQGLLEDGKFFGSESFVVAEALSWVRQFKEKLYEQSNAREEATVSSWHVEGSGGVHSDEVLHPGQQGDQNGENGT